MAINETCFLIKHLQVFWRIAVVSQQPTHQFAQCDQDHRPEWSSLKIQKKISNPYEKFLVEEENRISVD